MPLGPLTDPMIDLLLILLEMNRDILDRQLAASFSPRAAGLFGRVPDQNDVRVIDELKLTRDVIKVLEEAR